MNSAMKKYVERNVNLHGNWDELPGSNQGINPETRPCHSPRGLGNLSVGSEADIAILDIRKGNFGYWDKTGIKVPGDKTLECEMTIRGGKIVYDLNGIANPVVAPAK